MTPKQAGTGKREVAPDLIEQLFSRVAELEAERTRLLDVDAERTRLATMVAILQQVAAAPSVADAMVTVTRELGEGYKLDRSSIILIDQAGGARIVATHEDASIRNLSVELSRYPEVRRAIASGTTVFIPDVTAEPMSWMVKETLRKRNVGAAIVVPMSVDGQCMGALFLRTRRDQPPITDREIKFFESVAAIVVHAFDKAKAEAATARQQAALAASVKRLDAQRVALIAFLERLLGQFKDLDGQSESVAALAPGAEAELEKMVGLVMRSLGKGTTKG